MVDHLSAKRALATLGDLPQCRNAWQGADLDPPADFETIGCRRDRAWRPPVPSYGPPPFWATLRPGPPAGLVAVPTSVHHSSAVDILCKGPEGNVGSWFLQLYRFCAEAGKDATFFPVDTVAFDAARVCESLPTMNPGDSFVSGDVQCLLEERHRIWLKCS